MDSNQQILVKRYNECARRFKVLFGVVKHYPNMGLDLKPEELIPPTDLNLIYGQLNVVRKMLEVPANEQVGSLINEMDTALNKCWKWCETLDRKMTPFLLRSYCEKNPDLPMEHLLLVAQFMLNKTERLDLDQGKIDYLLTQCFCVQNEGMPRLRASSEEELKNEILKLLPEFLKYEQPGLVATLEQCDSFLHEVAMVATFEDLISGDYINKGRQLKNSFNQHFYNASVLAKCVQLNTVLRQKFAQLYQVENDKIRNFSQVLINTGMEVVQSDQGGDVTAESAMEFSEHSSKLINSEYGANDERLKTFVHIKEMLDKTVAFYGLDPNRSLGDVVVERNALDENRLATRIAERCRNLRNILMSLPERSAASVQIIELEKSRLVLSSWEREALLETTDNPDPEMRLSSQLLGQAAAIIAEINEAYAYYRSQASTAPHLLDTQLMTVNFFIMQAHQTADELDQLSNRMREKAQIERACDLSATRHKLLDTCWKIKV